MVMFGAVLDYSEEAIDMIEKLSTDNLDLLLNALEKNVQESKLNNNLSVVLVDFFCKHMMRDAYDDHDDDVEVNNEEYLKEPLKNYIQ